MNAQQSERARVFWQLAIGRKLKEAALARRDFDAVNYYAKQIEVAELEARTLLAGGHEPS